MRNGPTDPDEHRPGATDASGGRSGQNFTLGRLAFEKISAVEGIRLTPEMKRDLRRSAEEAATPDAARQRLAAKYGKPSA